MKNKLIILTLLSAISFSACGPTAPIQPTPDISAIHTSAAETVIAEFTLTAQAAPPTSELTVTQESTSTSATPESTTPAVETATIQVDIPLEASPTLTTCDNAVMLEDVTVPDGTEMTPGQDFVKTWKLKNTGSCTWGAGYEVIYAYGEKMAGVAEPLPTAVIPRDEVEVSVRFKAPDTAGEYTSTWRLANANKSAFGEFFFVKIVVR